MHMPADHPVDLLTMRAPHDAQHHTGIILCNAIAMLARVAGDEG
jgi:hypothetical protein